LVKGSGSNKRTPWHQDQSYWCVQGDQALTIWAPLDPVSMANTLEFVRGSHRRAPIYEAVKFDESSKFDGSRDHRPPMPDIELERDKHEIVSWELQPGDCLIFHCRMLHAAPGNPLPQSRRVLSTCWAGDDARYVEINSDLAPPVKGDGLKPGDHLSCQTFPKVRPRVA
jgi:ectoine hydroxylase-related dioxygenase (phytanoyl-CoA dioxygenase family)